MKITADYEAGTLEVETVAGPEAPSFAQGQKVSYKGELTGEALIEAHEYNEKRMAEMLGEDEAEVKQQSDI